MTKYSNFILFNTNTQHNTSQRTSMIMTMCERLERSLSDVDAVARRPFPCSNTAIASLTDPTASLVRWGGVTG